MNYVAKAGIAVGLGAASIATGVGVGVPLAKLRGPDAESPWVCPTCPDGGKVAGFSGMLLLAGCVGVGGYGIYRAITASSVRSALVGAGIALGGGALTGAFVGGTFAT